MKEDFVLRIANFKMQDANCVFVLRFKLHAHLAQKRNALVTQKNMIDE